MVSHGDRTQVHAHQQHMRALISPCPHKHLSLLLSVLFWATRQLCNEEVGYGAWVFEIWGTNQESLFS